MSNYPELNHKLRSLLDDLNNEADGQIGRASDDLDRLLVSGAIDRKHKELMALSIAICTNCHGCMAYHTHNALKSGATRLEILETIGVSIAMGGNPAKLNGAQAYAALVQFEQDTQGYKDDMYA